AFSPSEPSSELARHLSLSLAQARDFQIPAVSVAFSH
ncbi:hypothetical protein A2U01_0104780, partial [Trifolium medium]|nr:hypothetical protein [Trifolium medium]